MSVSQSGSGLIEGREGMSVSFCIHSTISAMRDMKHSIEKSKILKRKKDLHYDVIPQPFD